MKASIAKNTLQNNNNSIKAMKSNDKSKLKLLEKINEIFQLITQ